MLRLDLTRMYEYLKCIFVKGRRIGRQHALYGSVYRPPNTHIWLFNMELLLILNLIYQGTKFRLGLGFFFIAGDFNLNLLNINCHAATNEFVNNMLSYNSDATIS